MGRLNVSLDDVVNCEEETAFVKKGSSICCIYKDFHLKNPKRRTSLDQVKLVKAFKTRSGNKF